MGSLLRKKASILLSGDEFFLLLINKYQSIHIHVFFFFLHQAIKINLCVLLLCSSSFILFILLFVSGYVCVCLKMEIHSIFRLSALLS